MKQRSIKLVSAIVCATMLIIGCGRGANPLEKGSDKPVNQELVASNPAMALVERFNMGSNLEQMAILVAKSSHTYGMVAEKHGKENAQQVVTQEIQKLLPLYQAKWNTNLANAYAKNLSTEELRSLATEGKNSPYASKFKQVQNPVGEEMKKNSMPILTELLTEAMKNAIK